MAILKHTERKEKLIGKLAYGSDLLEEITRVCSERNIRLAWFEALGAVQKACVSFYDQKAHEYRPVEIDRPLEITNLVGNVSLKGGDPFVHAHITLADSEGHAFGGHLAPGTVVFACEFTLESLDGPVLERAFDDTTGLSLWAIEE
jgi:uncharacterized protein